MASVDCEVFVKLESGQTITLNAGHSDTVRMLAEQAARKAEISTDRLRLKYQGKVLNPNHTVGFLGIRVETILKAEVVQVKSWTVRVALEAEDRVVPVQVQNVSPVRHVMTRLKEEVRLPEDQQHLLKLGARVLRNMEETLMDAGVTDNAQLILVIEPKKPESEAAEAENEKVSGADLAEVVGTFDAGSRPVDVVFSFDTTGSMYSCLSQVRAKLREACSRLVADIERLRIGIIAHGDYCDYDTYVVRIQDLTRDVDRLVNFVDSVPSTGGGDSPECYEWALHKAQQMEWAEDSAKALIIIGDDLPHSVNYTDQQVNWHNELDVLKGMGVKVYGVQALNNVVSIDFYKHMAEHTGGAYIKFNNFNVITEMFLAVCYREADAGAQPEGEDEAAGGGNQLAAFMDQLQEEGRLEGDVQEVLQQVAQQAPAQPPVSDRYVAKPWWDPSLDTTIPYYKYDATTDSWTIFTSTPASIPSASPPASHSRGGSSTSGLTRGQSIRRALGKLRPKSSTSPSTKKSCAIM